MKWISYKRHLAKTITWRLVGTMDTIVLSWIITGNLFIGLKIGATEVITKMSLYYLHERIWIHLDVVESRRRHLLKTITWRMIGTFDTVVLSWFITGSAQLGLSIGGVEVFTKMILYYFHERTWYRIKFGLDERKALKNEEKYSNS